MLTWARGSVCVFPQDGTDPVWVPERLTRLVEQKDDGPPIDSSGDHDTVDTKDLE